MRNKSRYIAEGAMIAALYVIFTYVSMAFGLDKGVIQCRLSEAFTVLPILIDAAVPGLFAGCVIANILTGCALWDIIFGGIATLAGAFFTKKLRKTPYLASLPAIISNTVVVPPVLTYVYHVETAYPIIVLTVFLGEIISCGGLGTLLLYALKKHKKH